MRKGGLHSMSDYREYGEALEGQAKSLAVATTDDVSVAKAFSDACDEKIKEIKEYFGPKKKAAKDVHQDWVDAEKASLKPYTAAKAILKKKLSDFQKSLDKKVEEAGEESLVAAPVAATRKYWKFRITDVSKIPSEYMIPDETALGRLARSQKEKASVPGVEFYYDY